jgi:hypothetical protein
MSLETPSKIRTLQRKLYRKAKDESNYRFYLLYDKIYREDILAQAYDWAKAHQGAPGVDGQKVSNILIPSNTGPWPELRDRLNRILNGGSNYFSYGTRARAYRAVAHHVADRVHAFLRSRRPTSGRGTRLLADPIIFGPLGVTRLTTVRGARP